MTTQERTMYMLNNLPAKDQKDIHNYIERLFEKRKIANHFKKVNKQDVLKMIKQSDDDYQKGKFSGWEEVSERIHQRYGL